MRSDDVTRFVESYYQDVIDALKDVDEAPTDVQYRLGIRRLAKAFFDKFELFELKDKMPSLEQIDIDEWFRGK